MPSLWGQHCACPNRPGMPRVEAGDVARQAGGGDGFVAFFGRDELRRGRHAARFEIVATEGNDGAGMAIGVADASVAAEVGCCGRAVVWGFDPCSGVLLACTDPTAWGNGCSFFQLAELPGSYLLKHPHGAVVEVTVDMGARRMLVSVNGGAAVDAGVELPAAVRLWCLLHFAGDAVRLVSVRSSGDAGEGAAAAGGAAAGMAADAPQQAAAASMGEETREAMASLAAMGFTDVDSNLAVLQKHSTVEAALDELLGSAAQGGAQGEGAHAGAGEKGGYDKVGAAAAGPKPRDKAAHVKHFSDAALSKATSNYSARLGSGSAGSVFKGVLTSGTQIAVKKLLDATEHGHREQMYTEVEVLSCVQHVNIVPLLGWSEEATPCVVYALMEGGSLEDRLACKGGGRAPLTASERMIVLSDVARGLAFLHTEVRVIHRDVKSSNVLIDSGCHGRIGDFGIAKCVSSGNGMTATHLHTQPIGTKGVLQ